MPILRSRILSLVLIMALSIFQYACSNNKVDGPMTKLQWINPSPEESVDGLYILKVTNNSDYDYLSDNWNLYFNSLHNIGGETESDSFELKHINGDYYQITLKDGVNFISGKTLEITLKFTRNLIKYSSLPHGFYTVMINESGEKKYEELELLAAGTIRHDEVQISKSDVHVMPDAELRYQENAYLQSLKQNDLLIIPTPELLKIEQGRSHAVRKLWVESDEIFLETFNAFVKNFDLPLDVEFGKIKNKSTNSGMNLLLKLDENIKDSEAYKLSISESNGICIRSGSETGLFYALQSLKSLLEDQKFKKDSTLPFLTIEDKPRFSYRGLHIDVARNFHTKTEIFRMLDVMALYKLNRMHLHLTDDEGWRIEIPSLPELTRVGGKRGHSEDEDNCLNPAYGSGPFAKEDTYFSRVDFLEILRYADKRFIEIIPEIDLPGHSRAAIKAMENRYRYYAALGEMDKASEYRLIHPEDDSKYKSVQNFNDNVIDPGLPSTYKFVDVVVSELSEMYRESGLKMKWLHLGGDEVPRGVWENSPAVKKMIKENEELNIAHDLFAYFFIQSAGILEALDCRMVGWEEVVNSVSSGDTDILPQKDYLTPIAYIWNTVWGWDREDWAYRMAEKGYPVILSNVGNLYFDLAYNSDPEEKGLFWAGYHNTRNVFEFTPFDFRKSAWIGRMGHPVDMEKFQAFKALAKSNEKMIYGIQGQLWSERLPDEERLHYMALPKTLALAERAWAKQPDWAVIAKDGDRLSSLDSAWADFTDLIGQKELPRLDKMISNGYSYRIPLPGAVIENGLLKANILYNGLDIHYTEDGSEPDRYSKIYSEPLKVMGPVKLRVFTSNGRGGRVVEIRKKD